MLQYINQKRGQSTLEYAILVVVVIGALLSIQVYVKRGIQGRLKSSSDDIGDQYSPGNTNVTKIVTTNGTTLDTFGMGGGQGVSVSKIVVPEYTNTSESMNIVNGQQEYYGK